MIENKDIFERKFDSASFDNFYENPNSLKSLTNDDKNIIFGVADNEMFVDTDTLNIKNEGVIKELVVEDNKVILKEI